MRLTPYQMLWAGKFKDGTHLLVGGCSLFGTSLFALDVFYFMVSFSLDPYRV